MVRVQGVLLTPTSHGRERHRCRDAFASVRICKCGASLPRHGTLGMPGHLGIGGGDPQASAAALDGLVARVRQANAQVAQGMPAPK